MAVSNYAGKLNANEIFGAIYNMIISQQVFSDNIAGTYSDLVDSFRVDGTLYGDTKLYYATDALATQEWLGDNEAQNLLKIHRPEDPECQAITIDQFRMIPLTVDNYLSKRAYSTEGAFSNVQSVMLGWMKDTKKIYDSTLMNTYVGTTKSNANRAEISVPVKTAVGSATGEEANRLEAQAIAESLANLLVDMKDVSRDFNDYGNLRSSDPSQLKVIWNSKYVNKITKVDLPTIFHKEGLFNDFSNILPARFFGNVITSTATSDGTYRTVIEADYASSDKVIKHLFPGDIIPSGAYKVLTYTEGTPSSKYRSTGTRTAATMETKLLAGEAYKVDDTVICKIVHKDAIPFMSAFETGTSFFNNRSLTENHYLIWGYSKPQYLYDKPFITVKAA